MPHPCSTNSSDVFDIRTPSGSGQLLEALSSCYYYSQDWRPLPHLYGLLESSSHLEIMHNGQHIPGSPFRPDYRSEGIVDVAKSWGLRYPSPWVFAPDSASDQPVLAVAVAGIVDRFGNPYREPPLEAEHFHIPNLTLVYDFDKLVRFWEAAWALNPLQCSPIVSRLYCSPSERHKLSSHSSTARAHVCRAEKALPWLRSPAGGF